MTRSREALAAALVAVVVLAGCGSVATPGEEGTPTRTITAVPVPQETATPRGPPVLAPGISTEGVFDARRLADAHAATLSATSFTAVRHERRFDTNGSLRLAYRSVIRMGADGERFTYELNQTDVRGDQRREQSLSRYSDGAVVYAATTRGGQTTYSVLGGTDEPTDPAAVFPENATARFGVLRLFGALRFDVLGQRTVDGWTVYRLGVENGSQSLGGLDDVSMNATVREDGVVLSYRLTYEVSDVRVVVDVDFGQVGETEVTPSEWVTAARSATGVEPSTTGDETPTPAPTPTATRTGTTADDGPPTAGVVTW